MDTTAATDRAVLPQRFGVDRSSAVIPSANITTSNGTGASVNPVVTTRKGTSTDSSLALVMLSARVGPGDQPRLLSML